MCLSAVAYGESLTTSQAEVPLERMHVFYWEMGQFMSTRGLEVDNANPEIVINAIQDKNMKYLIKFKRRQTEEGQSALIQFKAPDKEPLS